MALPVGLAVAEEATEVILNLASFQRGRGAVGSGIRTVLDKTQRTNWNLALPYSMWQAMLHSKELISVNVK